jgi:hypothetical protein
MPQQSPKWLTWLVAGVFAAFAIRAFSEALFIKDGRLYANDPYDTAMHVTYVNYLASGVAFWPADCIYSREPLHYPIGADLFTSLLVIEGGPIQWCFLIIGILASAATAKTLWKWGGTFTVAGFLFNGGLEGFKYLAGKGLEQISYEVDWKSIPIIMFALQRSWLYALPAGLILLISWRKRILKNEKGLPLWIEWCLYTTMPLFHIHTFIFLSAMLGIWALTGPNRKETIKLVLLSVPISTLLVELVAGFGNAGMIHLKWGWCQGNKEFWQYWLSNFGILPILTALLPVWLLATKKGRQADPRITIPSILLFLVFLNVMFALYEWDNNKLLLWCYLGILPAIGEMLLWAKTWSENKYAKSKSGWILAQCGFAAILTLLFFSGAIALWKYIENGPRTWDLASVKELEEIETATAGIPPGRIYVCLRNTANHPLLLTGHKIPAGFGVHIWSHGYKNTGETEKEVDEILNGAPEWERCAKDLKADYVFWGREEKERFPKSTIPWAKEPIKAKGQDWTLYDLRETARAAKDQLVGTWSLVSVTAEEGGNKLEPFGPNPQGLMMLDGNGHFSVVITHPPKFTSNHGMEGNNAAVQGSIGYFGTYSISEADKSLTIHIEASTFPNYTGTDQKRPFTLIGDELKWTNSTTSIGATGSMVWKRVK